MTILISKKTGRKTTIENYDTLELWEKPEAVGNAIDNLIKRDQPGYCGILDTTLFDQGKILARVGRPAGGNLWESDGTTEEFELELIKNRTTKKIILKNDFHNTEVGVMVYFEKSVAILTRSQTLRVKRILCGMSDCSCGCVRGPQGENGELCVDETHIPNGSKEVYKIEVMSNDWFM